ncbi:hypothetical protein PACTADRAFT_49177 [Pachysolen tannophilus NRRL Y-2460]|uniref:USP domain-containing protein n=1 Tax=Pachysolen tannophilus NRRL Y-2460 TaxID=669874 RepID=A0A1E4U0A5_PACTA|nr:hypothetical protein PACTADRAFT_49177 [Pachysolen tannophilus NRRL Y-2460]
MLSSSRPDKYTTGMINMTVDCFANSTLQSLASLPGLNIYLNKLNEIYLKLIIIKNEQEKLPPLPILYLHEALVEILSNLQQVVTSSKAMSVWDFLSVLEKVFNAKISRKQHDAHELLQLILETLDKENFNLTKFVAKNSIELIVPEFPFKSLYSDQLQCLSCGRESNLNYDPMMILTLPVPQTNTIELTELIRKNESEYIEGYSCLKCKIKAIVTLEEKNQTLKDDIFETLKSLNNDDNLLINDDIPKNLENIINNYKLNTGFDIKNVKSTINKKNLVIRPPQILPIHLSRSIFLGTQEIRNSCQVLFSDHLTLEIDENLKNKVEELEKLKHNSRIEKEKMDDDQEEINSLQSLKPSILNDIDEKAEDEFYEDVGQSSDVDSDNGSIAEEDETGQDVAINNSDTESGTSASTTSDKSSSSSSEKHKKKLNNLTPPTTYSSNQSTAVSQFEEPQVIEADPANIKSYKYRLKAVIRHQGTHSTGHYECYRHKPEFIKDSKSGEYVANFPFLENKKQHSDDTSMKPQGTESETNVTNTTENETAVSDSANTHLSDDLKPRSRSSSVRSPSFSRPFLSSDAGPSITDNDEGHGSSLSRSGSRRSRFRSRLSSLVGDRRPSISQDLNNDMKTLNLKEGKPKKIKKLTSYVKYPYWRISDTKITEYKKEDVLNDSKAVYMLFYERVQE